MGGKMKEGKRFDFWDGALPLILLILQIVLLVLLLCQIALSRHEAAPAAEEAPPPAKPVLYVTAVTPYVFLGAENGARLVTLDENLNERVFKFHSEKEAAKFLSDISLNFEIADYTGVYH
jgi:flagellar basal body-associated protein FliL